MPWQKRLPFYYGWVVVAVAFICFMVGYAAWHSFSIFYVAILEETHWSRGATAAVFSLFSLVYGLNGPLMGTLIDRFGPRVVLPMGALLLGVGLILTAGMSSMWEYFLLFGVVSALGLGGFGTVPTMTVLSNWFVRKRGTAAGFATAGIGVGIFFLVPILQMVILSYSWRVAYVVLAVIIMLVVPAVSLSFIRRRPQDLGLLPDGDEPGARPTTTRLEQVRSDALVIDKEWAMRNWTLGSAARTRRFWFILCARFLETSALQFFLSHQAALLGDFGFDKMVAASVVALVGIVGSSGKIMWGIVSDRIGREMSYTLAYILGTLGVVILMTVGPGSPMWVPFAYAIVYGFCYAATAVILPALAADVFHGKQFGSILGGLYIGSGLGSATGTFAGGFIYDMTGSYRLALMLALPAMWLSCLLFWLAAPRKVRLVAGKAMGRAAAPGGPAHGQPQGS